MQKFNVLTVLILTIFNIAQNSVQGSAQNNDQLHGHSLETDFKKFIRLLRDLLRTDQGLLSRAVFIDDDQHVTINQFYKGLDTDRSHTYMLFHILNIVLSCEFSEIIYYYIGMSDNSFQKCKSQVSAHKEILENSPILDNCLRYYRSNYLDTFLEQTERITLSLSRLEYFTKNIVSKYHDVFKMTLAWHIYLHKMNKDIYAKSLVSQSYSTKKKLLESITITNFQMKSRVMRFLMKHCYSPVDFVSFVHESNNNIKANETSSKLIRNKTTRSIALTNHILDGMENQNHLNQYVIRDYNFGSLIDLLVKRVPGGSIKINWKGEKVDLKKYYYSNIKTSIHINVIVHYEKILLEVISEIIFLHEIKKLENLLYKYKKNDKREKCFNMLEKVQQRVEKLRHYKLYKDNSIHQEPLILIRFFYKNQIAISHICELLKDYENKFQEIKDTITKWRKDFNHIQNVRENSKLGSFLESLSDYIIKARLHPTILNLFWEKYFVYYTFDVGYYAVDNQYLYTTYNESIDKNTCYQMMEIQGFLKDVYRVKVETNEDHSYVIESDISPKKYENILIQLANITINTVPPYFLDWERILLTVITNKGRVDVEKNNVDTDTHVRRVAKFIYTLSNIILENQYVQCSCGVSSDYKQLGNCKNAKNKEFRNPTTEVDQLRKTEELANIYKYVDELRSMTDRVQKVMENFKPHKRYSLYWDGVKKNLSEFHETYELQSFDLQDGLDYISFFVKWMIAVPFANFMSLTLAIENNAVIKDLLKPRISDLSTNIDNFLQIEWLKRSSIQLYLPDFIPLIESFVHWRESKNRKDKKTALAMKEVMFDKFFFLNMSYLPEFEKNDIPKWVTTFTEEINQLVISFKQDFEIPVGGNEITLKNLDMMERSMNQNRESLEKESIKAKDQEQG